MIRNYYEGICRGEAVRQNLIALRRELKTEENKRALAYLLGGEFQVFTDLLKAEDPKIRKNAALILGGMETEDVLPFLFAAYQREETLFVRTDYLKAMERLDYFPYLEKLKSKLEDLERQSPTEENKKHLRQEQLQLQAMILKYEKPKKHVFLGYDTAPEVLLITNRCQIQATREQVSTGAVSAFSQGLRIKGGNLRELMKIRTFSELLFPLPGVRSLSGTPEEIGRGLARAGLPEFLLDLHKKGGNFYYRIEVKGPMSLEKKGPFIRRVSRELDEASQGQLRNSAAEYEAEVRLLEKKDGSFVPLVKLFTLEDHRFDYRRETVAASISPVNAALTVQLAKKYLKEDAQILDPFCGVGTMLLERNRAVKADPMYGVDIFGEAIEKARENTRRAGAIVHYINRDFFDFTHEYLFDEMITDMPRVSGTGGREELAALYRRFFERASGFLKQDGVMILYTMDPKLVEENLSGSTVFRKEQEFLINEKNLTKVFVITKKI